MSLNMELYQMAPFFQNALYFTQLTDGQVNTMTDADELLSQAATNAAAVHFDERRNAERAYNTSTGALPKAIGYEVFTDSNVASANTVAGLSGLVDNYNAGITAGYFSGTHLG